MILSRFAKTMSVAGSARIELSGNAIDQDAQILKASPLRWLDGSALLGTGTSISAGPLPPGLNHIRLVARDPSGRTASASVTVKIGAVALPAFLKLKLPSRLSASAHKLTLEASAALPATLTIGRRSFKLSTKLKKLSVAIAAGHAALLVHLSVSADGVATPFVRQIPR